MNNLLKVFLCSFFLSLLCTNFLNAQNLSTGNTWVGKTYGNETPNVDEQRILRQADMEYSQGDLEQAFLTLEEAYALNPASVQILLRRATLKKVLGMDNESKIDFKAASRMNPYAADLFGYNHSGNIINVLSSKPENALLGLNTYQRLDYYYGLIDNQISDSDASVKEIEFISEIIVNLEEDDLFTASELVDSLLLSFPNSAVGYDLQGTIFLQQEKYDEANTALNKAVIINPDFAIAWYNLSRVEAMIGHLSQAKTYLDKALELQSDLTKAYFDRALINKKQGNPEAAIADYDKVIEMKGSFYPEAYLNRGLTKKILGDFQGALNDINQVVEYDKFESSEALINRGNLHMVLGLTERAVEDYTLAIDIEDDNAEAYYNRGLAFLILLDNMSACADLDKSIGLGFEKAQEILNNFCSN